MRFYQAVQQFIKARPTPTQSAQTLKAALRKLIFEKLLLAEMKDLRLSGGGLKEARRKLVARRRSDRAGEFEQILKRFGKTEAEVVDQIRRDLDAQEFLERKLATLQTKPLQADIEREIRSYPMRYKDLTSQAARNAAAGRLKRKKMEDGIEDWVRVLRDKYGVVNYLDR